MTRIASKWFGRCLVLHSTHVNFREGDVINLRWGAVMEVDQGGGYVSLRKEDAPDFDCWAIREGETDLFKIQHKVLGKVAFALVACSQYENDGDFGSHLSHECRKKDEK